MKKALLIILSLILMLSGVWSALIVSAVAVAPDFEDTSKWVIYTDLSTHVNSEKGKVSSWGKTKLNTNPSYIAEGDKSVKFYSQWQRIRQGKLRL